MQPKYQVAKIGEFKWSGSRMGARDIRTLKEGHGLNTFTIDMAIK